MAGEGMIAASKALSERHGLRGGHLLNAGQHRAKHLTQRKAAGNVHPDAPHALLYACAQLQEPRADCLDRRSLQRVPSRFIAKTRTRL